MAGITTRWVRLDVVRSRDFAFHVGVTPWMDVFLTGPRWTVAPHGRTNRYASLILDVNGHNVVIGR